jgi:RHS repeat-associated protein
MVRNEKFYLYHNEPNGCPTRLLDESGKIVWAARYDAWGRIKKLIINDVDQPLRLQGQYFDRETGLYYNRFRYYCAEIGAFVSQDPLGLVAGENVYGFGPNAQTWVDPLGLACKGIAKQAASWQGQVDYPGVDNWKNTTLKKGTIIYGGTPGQTEFYTTKSYFERHSKKAETFWRRMQVKPHDTFGYRKEVTAYEVIEDISAARARTSANPHFGEGGAPQVFVPDYQTNLKPLYKVKLR